MANPRRAFLKGAGVAFTAAAVGANIPFIRNIPKGFVPAAFAEDMSVPEKEGLRILSERPFCAETEAHLLDDSVTPTSRHFVRNNGTPVQNADVGAWTLEIDGLVERPARFSIADLRSQFEVVSKALVIECAGNGRAFFDPPTLGNQWTRGAVACSLWTGVRLADVLQHCGIQPEALYTAHFGADRHLSGDPAKEPISRGVPISKALDGSVLIAFEQNQAPLHPTQGAPLRLVVPGWPGSCSHKWLTRIWVRDQVHDGAKMTGESYRVPTYPVEPGEKVGRDDLRIIERMPVKSLITHPQNGVVGGSHVEVRGHAWSGERSIDQVDLSYDFGATWQAATLDPPMNPGAWQDFRIEFQLTTPGYYEVWARATDSADEMQPHAINWNQKGYLNNAMHRVALRVA